MVGPQHVLAMFIGIIPPPLVASRALDFSPSQTAYLVSMALVASGLATFVQVSRLGPVGSGLVRRQGAAQLPGTLSIALPPQGRGLSCQFPSSTVWLFDGSWCCLSSCST